MTVSNVLNGSGRVSEETARRVWAAARTLDYRPSLSARRLRLSRKWAIGMLIVTDDADFLSDPMITAQVTGLVNFLTRENYSLILRSVRHGELDSSDMFQGVEADGLVVILPADATQRRQVLDQLASMNLPTILLQEQQATSRSDWIVLRQDDLDAGHQVGRHLLSRGASRMWMVLPSVDWPALDARARGVAEEVALAGAPDLRIVRSPTESLDDVVRIVSDALAEERPEAIIGGNDQMAIGAMKACRAMDLDVPGDVQIVGFNGFEFSRYSEPELTTVRSAAHALGERAGAALLKRLSSGEFESREIVLPVALVEGATTKRPSRPRRPRAGQAPR